MPAPDTRPDQLHKRAYKELSCEDSECSGNKAGRHMHLSIHPSIQFGSGASVSQVAAQADLDLVANPDGIPIGA